MIGYGDVRIPSNGGDDRAGGLAAGKGTVADPTGDDSVRCGDCKRAIRGVARRAPAHDRDTYCPRCGKSCCPTMDCPHCGSLVCAACGSITESAADLGFG